MFTSTSHGFKLTFANGWTASIQFSNTHYAYGLDVDHRGQPTATLAEMAAYKENAWHIFDDGQSSKGYQTVEEVLAFLNLVNGKVD